MARTSVSNLMFTNEKVFHLITPSHIKVENIHPLDYKNAWIYTYTVKTTRRLEVSGCSVAASRPEDVVRQINTHMIAEANRIKYLVEQTSVEPEPEEIEIEVSL